MKVILYYIMVRMIIVSCYKDFVYVQETVNWLETL